MDAQERITTWHRYFMEMALLSARKSPDTSIGVGCVIVGPDHEVRTTGYNGLPRGIEYTPKRRERPEKYVWVEHAERNAIYNAARVGTSLLGCTAYIASTDQECRSISPCADCCRGLIQAGIKEIVAFYGTHPDAEGRPWASTLEASRVMLQETGVTLTLLDQETFEPVSDT